MPGPKSPRVPVVVVHGALRGRMGLVPTAWILRHNGLDARTFGYRTRTDSLQAHARALSTFLDTWLGDSRPEVIGFVTHSMGGLVVRAYLAEAGERHADVQRVVMLSPPNRGSALAAKHANGAAFRWLYGTAASELLPNAVQSLPGLPSSAEVLVLAGGRGDCRGYNPGLEGDDDGVVAVAEMALPDSALEMVGGVHGMLQWRPAVLRRAAGFLKGSGSVAPGQDYVAPDESA